ncbi:N(6)-hydroxylysine O-acetyltransferase [Pectobacterium araliae]|uniref:GNAT family N-acetyltransferase n=1 Tax=Pectobacterium araliae TaxID=3073862 RepID=A0AAN0KM01_9GAMM|nr:GNAT family N-acetyltransferase [Pectobacterium sp. MAFF 302110]GKW21399.1 N(6)-hydroxylysine O-acetyltransferase [Pectobacterium carotovorum subsp. carotovorum]
MPHASIVHDGYGFGCTQQDIVLPLTLGLDGSAVLDRLENLPSGWLVEALDQLFVAAPQLTGITLPWARWCDEPQAQALFAQVQSDYLSRETFWQLPLWMSGERPASRCDMQFDDTRQLYFPVRPPRPHGEVYRRYDAQLKRVLSFRLVDLHEDVERFTQWMNTPRVNAFWEMAGPREEQENYLRRQLDSSYCYPLIGCFDDQPFGYFEIYWAAEDRIGRHYRWQPFDRGMHMLVGEESWRGAPYIRSWLRGLSHYLWLDEPRTTRLVAEPRFDNQRLFRHLPVAGFETLKEFDFPHKRSRLVMSSRDRFFREVGL